MQNLGPLTSIWTQPVTCHNTLIGCLSLPCTFGWAAQTCSSTASGSNLWIHEAADCFPPRTASATTPAGSTFDIWGYYSPGVFCPDGYKIAATQVGNGSDVAPDGLMPLASTQTAAACCPTGYSYDYPNNGDQRCVQKLTGQTAFAAQICGVTINNVQMNLPTSYSVDGVGVVTVTTNDFVYPAIRIVWQESDLSYISEAASSGFTASPSAAVAGSTPTDSGSISVAASPTQTTTQGSNTGLPASSAGDGAGPTDGLSTGAKAGIGAAFGVVGLALLILAGWLIMRHRRKAQLEKDNGVNSTVQSTMASPHYPYSPPDGQHYETYQHQQDQENQQNQQYQHYQQYQQPQQQQVYAQQYHDKIGDTPQAEMSGEGRVMYELPVSSNQANAGQ